MPRTSSMPPVHEITIEKIIKFIDEDLKRPAKESALHHFEIDGANIIRIFEPNDYDDVVAGEKEIILDVLVRRIFLYKLDRFFEIPQIYSGTGSYYSRVGESEIGISFNIANPSENINNPGGVHNVLAAERNTYLLFRRFLAQKRFNHIDSCLKAFFRHEALFLHWIEAEHELGKSKLSGLPTVEISSNVDNLIEKLEAISSINENIDSTNLSEIGNVFAEICEEYGVVADNLKKINKLINKHNQKLENLLTFKANIFPGIHDQLNFGKTLFQKQNSLAYKRTREHRKEFYLYDEE